MQDAQRLRRLEACRAALLDPNVSPLSVDDQAVLKEHAVKLKLPPEAYLNRCEQKLKNLTTSKMSPEKLMKVVEDLLLYPPGPDLALLEQMRPEDRLVRTQFMLRDAVATACEQVSDGLSVSKMLQKIHEAYKDYLDTIVLLSAAENWEREKLQQLKSEAMEAVRSAKANLKKMEKEMKGRAAQRRLDRKAATLSKLDKEAAEAQREQNSDRLEEISSLMNEESKDLADQVEELDEDGSKLADHAEELRLQAVNSAYKAKRQAQRIRLSKEDRGSLISVPSSAGRPKVQPQNLRFNEEAAPTVRGSPTYGSAHMAAGAQQEDVAGDPPSDYSGIGGRPAESLKAEPPATDDPWYEREREWFEEDEDEWFTPHQENTDRRCRHANVDYQGSHSASHTKDKLIIDALRSIANRQELPSKPPWARCQPSLIPTERFRASARTWKRS